MLLLVKLWDHLLRYTLSSTVQAFGAWFHMWVSSAIFYMLLLSYVVRALVVSLSLIHRVLLKVYKQDTENGKGGGVGLGHISL
jgi:hypothetical protein